MDDELWKSYQKTNFVIEFPAREVILRIGKQDAGIDGLLLQHKPSAGAFITAYNPGSIRLSNADNERRHKELVAELTKRHHIFMPGRGVGEDPAWLPERSLFVLGINLTEAIEIGQLFGQVAIVWKLVNRPTELIRCSSTDLRT